MALSAIYVKGFKTFARPVRMPLEGGITAIVGPNGSGKSNITDAVLFALGEQSPAVLRAGAMGELIFAGSEALPAASAAEVTLVLDNGSGEISLPYGEVSVTRRISRAGETEYRINGSRARLADVRAVAGEAGLGRHSILRQGAVDAIVAGGAAACRLALEEAAGLGVYRRRRQSASRRLERADAQLEKSRQLELDLADQLRRIEKEAAAAREYRKLESRYRELSLAHLYRLATRELAGLRRRLAAARVRASELASREESLREEEAGIGRRLQGLGDELKEADRRLESVEDATEDLRAETLRTDRALLRLEAGRGREGERRLVVSRLKEELRRVTETLEGLGMKVADLEAERTANREAAEREQRVLAESRERSAAVERERSRLAGRLESLRARLARATPDRERRVASEEDISGLAEASKRLEGAVDPEPGAKLRDLRGGLRDALARVEALTGEASRRGGALSAAIGRSESRARALRESAPGGAATRLYEVIRARPGYEVAVEAALGEYGAGVLAADLDEGLGLLSDAEPVAVRLDARAVEKNGTFPGRPLLDCVEVVDGRYAEAVERLLGGIFVVEKANQGPEVNGYVAVTRDGLRLTRTGVSLRAGAGTFAREARLAAELDLLQSLKEEPGGTLQYLKDNLTDASERLDRLTATARKLSALADRTSRARSLLSREASRRKSAAESSREDFLQREEAARTLSRQASETGDALARAVETSERAKEDLARAATAADGARAASDDSERRLRDLRSTLTEGEGRRASISARLRRAAKTPEGDGERVALATARAARASRELVTAVRERRNALRRLRAEAAEAHRRASDERTTLSRRAVDLAGELATARAGAERLAEELERTEASSERATQEISTEWGATPELARQEADKHPENTEPERQALARKLKRFGDVNLLALSQEEGLRERHDFVAAQRADAEAAAADLNRIIQSIDRDIEVRFSETFEEVRGAFGEMVPRMLAGASGVLELSEEGVEIGLRLGRKGWRPLRVLSGGERALLALSFLFSVFLSRPGRSSGAFCVLDEAEAALDDLNLARFLSVVDSYRAKGQYLLVTHQKRTMAAADVLYGVVQDASGATTVVSKRLQGE